MPKAVSPKSDDQGGASKTSLLAQLANNLTISALAAHSPFFSFCLLILSFFLVPSFSSTPLLLEDHKGECPLFS